MWLDQLLSTFCSGTGLVGHTCTWLYHLFFTCCSKTSWFSGHTYTWLHQLFFTCCSGKISWFSGHNYTWLHQLFFYLLSQEDQLV
jgi:hypothetical protein